MSDNVVGMRAMYTVQFPASRQKGEDETGYNDRVRQSENFMNQNFSTLHQVNAELALRLASLENWASNI